MKSSSTTKLNQFNEINKHNTPLQLNQPSIMNAYFKSANTSHKQPSHSSHENKQQHDTPTNTKDPNSKEHINELVQEKIKELNTNVERLQREHNKVLQLKAEYDRLLVKFKNDNEDFAKKKEIAEMEFETQKANELKRIEREKQIQKRNTNLLQDFPTKKERTEIDNLKEQIFNLEQQLKERDKRNKLNLNRLKKQLDDAYKKNESLMQAIKVYENMK